MVHIDLAVLPTVFTPAVPRVSVAMSMSSTSRLGDPRRDGIRSVAAQAFGFELGFGCGAGFGIGLGFGWGAGPDGLGLVGPGAGVLGFVIHSTTTRRVPTFQ